MFIDLTIMANLSQMRRSEISLAELTTDEFLVKFLKTELAWRI